MPTKQRVFRASQWDVYWLGLTIVIGGQIIFWNKGLAEGFWKFFISMLIVGLGYLCLTLCLAEMTSMMPFAGGSFGYVRCTFGPVTGYLVGCCESAEYILYVASAVVEIGRLLTVITELSPSFEPLYWISFYAISLVIQMKGGRTFWRFNCIIAIITLLLIVMYCLASLPSVNFSKFATSYKDHDPGASSSSAMMSEVFRYFPLVSWFYVGVESMTLACDDVRQANRRVPWMMVFSMITLLITSTSIVLASCSQEPGTLNLQFTDLPLSPGYAKAFQYASPRFLAFLAIPGTFSTSFGFMFAYGRQLKAMARSGLFPGYLGQAWGKENVPLTALLTGSIIGCSVLLFLWLLFPSAIDRLFGLCMLSSCTVYVAIFSSFLIARKRLDTVPRTFVSPFGRVGAVYGIIVFSVMAVTLAVFQQDHYVSLIVYLVAITGAILHYMLIARKREFLSIEEQAQFMKAYLLHSDAEYRRRMVRRSFANKNAFLKRVAPFSTQKFGGLGQRWSRHNVTAPVELLHGLDENQHTAASTPTNALQSSRRPSGSQQPTTTSSSASAALTAQQPSTSAGHSALSNHEATSTMNVQFDTPTELTSSGNNETSLKPHELHLASSLRQVADAAAENEEDERNGQGYNANNHQMTLELEEKMRKLAEEIFAGQDEGQVTIVRSRHGRRSLTFRWKESSPSSLLPVSSPSGNNSHVSLVSLVAAAIESTTIGNNSNNNNSNNQNSQSNVRNNDAASMGKEDAGEIRAATGTISAAVPTVTSNLTATLNDSATNNISGDTAVSSPQLMMSGGNTGGDRIIRLAESDTAVEIIPGLSEDVTSPDDAYNFYPQHHQLQLQQEQQEKQQQQQQHHHHVIPLLQIPTLHLQQAPASSRVSSSRVSSSLSSKSSSEPPDSARASDDEAHSRNVTPRKKE